MRGFYNRVLSVNMTQRSFDTKTFPDDVIAKFLGGKGLATYTNLRSRLK
jgi:aldehyde:ferredoxin oxidoreductase